MDIVRILRSSIERLPRGDHTLGLLSVLRHIDAAVRHFDRGGNAEEDAYTDAIYRSNQAFEGSLKEAYRVIAEKDPAGMSPYQIESYLEDNKTVRSRVLVQLTRYRQDYRNPSTHDYRLDFDEDESLLAIVSVCAFAKLLVDQISEKLAFTAAQATNTSIVDQRAGIAFQPRRKNFNFIQYILKFLEEVLEDEAVSRLETPELEGTLAGLLSSAGVNAKVSVPIEGEDGNVAMEWDILTNYRNKKIPIEVRPGYTSDNAVAAIGFARRMLLEKPISDIVLVFTSGRANSFSVETIEIDEKKRVHVIRRDDFIVSY